MSFIPVNEPLLNGNEKKYLLGRDTIIEEELIRGYEYHQNEAKKDEKLMEWIKRESYINNGSIK